MCTCTINKARTDSPERLGKLIIVVGNFSTPFLVIYRTSKQKLDKDNFIQQLDLSNINMSTQHQRNIPSFQVHVECTQR